ncbi:hypothetical protein, partial [Thiorhodospira sibirica]|uniref:hypothetical protein n=1 Tax=Thiorhodospira sibirica TaxID=154347 RepID=UPI0005940E94
MDFLSFFLSLSFEFPDPKDQSVNNPHRLVEREVVLALYNQAKPNNSYSNVSETVRNWFEVEAKRQGWTSVQFVNQAAVLVATVTLG